MNMSPPFDTAFTLVSCWAYSSALKMEATYSSTMSDYMVLYPKRQNSIFFLSKIPNILNNSVVIFGLFHVVGIYFN
jgi:hypothetical protein